MIARNHKSSTCPGLITGIVCVLLAVALLPPVTQAAPSAFPPRPTPQPAPPSPGPTLLSRPPAGGFIELRFQTTPERIWSSGRWEELWTIVQWQDVLGNWHDVEGWQGAFDEFNHNEDKNVCAGKKTWWVTEADFDKGPFRWVVYQGRGGGLLARSELFYLPHSTGEIVRVEVSLVP